MDNGTHHFNIVRPSSKRSIVKMMPLSYKRYRLFSIYMIYAFLVRRSPIRFKTFYRLHIYAADRIDQRLKTSHR